MNHTPLRRIISTSYEHHKITSYGLVVYSKKNKKWIMVRRKHSIEYVMLMKGRYEKSFIPVLLKGLTLEEIKNLEKFLLNSSYYFNEIKKFNKPGVFHLNNCYDLFKNCKDVITTVLNKMKKDKFTWYELQWEWPKGMCDKNESGINCAIREFKEEVGIDISNFSAKVYSLKSQNNLYSDKIIELYFWLYIIDDDFIINPCEEEDFEISERKWMTEKEVYEVLSVKRTGPIHSEPSIIHRNEVYKNIFENSVKYII